MWRKAAALILAVILAATSCIAGRVPRPGLRTRMQLRVVRQCEGTDEAGKPFAKVFVQGGGTLTQNELDSMVLQGKCPELLFTSQDQKATFEACKSNNLPIELHVEPQASAGAGSDRHIATSGPPATAHMDEAGREANVEAMDAYVESYGSMQVHSLMLRDQPRCEWYRTEIERACKRVKEGAVVLDVGCGTGLLSLFAARAGAKKVFAVESNRHMAALATNIVADNGSEKVVTVICGKIEEVALPEEKVDIIVSEWMGFYLLHESMLDSVISARDRFLKPSGTIIPMHARYTHQPSLQVARDRQTDRTDRQTDRRPSPKPRNITPTPLNPKP